MNNDENRSSFFETSDLPLAVTLVCLGFVLDSLDGNNPSRIVFNFRQNETLQEAIGKYWAGSLCVEPKQFWSTQRDLKARIRSEFHNFERR